MGNEISANLETSRNDLLHYVSNKHQWENSRIKRREFIDQIDVIDDVSGIRALVAELREIGSHGTNKEETTGYIKENIEQICKQLHLTPPSRMEIKRVSSRTQPENLDNLKLGASKIIGDAVRAIRSLESDFNVDSSHVSSLNISGNMFANQIKHSEWSDLIKKVSYLHGETDIERFPITPQERQGLEILSSVLKDGIVLGNDNLTDDQIEIRKSEAKFENVISALAKMQTSQPEIYTATIGNLMCEFPELELEKLVAAKKAEVPSAQTTTISVRGQNDEPKKALG